VVQGNRDLVANIVISNLISELDLLNQVLMRVLSESASLISLNEDVINVELNIKISALEALLQVQLRVLLLEVRVDTVLKRSKIEDELRLMILKSNNRKSRSRRSGEPELKRNVNMSSLVSNSLTNNNIITLLVLAT